MPASSQAANRSLCSFTGGSCNLVHGFRVQCLVDSTTINQWIPGLLQTWSSAERSQPRRLNTTVHGKRAWAGTLSFPENNLHSTRRTLTHCSSQRHIRSLEMRQKDFGFLGLLGFKLQAVSSSLSLHAESTANSFISKTLRSNIMGAHPGAECRNLPETQGTDTAEHLVQHLSLQSTTGRERKRHRGVRQTLKHLWKQLRTSKLQVRWSPCCLKPSCLKLCRFCTGV